MLLLQSLKTPRDDRFIIYVTFRGWALRGLATLTFDYLPMKWRRELLFPCTTCTLNPKFMRYFSLDP